MYTKRNYGFWMTFYWSKTPFIYGFFYALALCLIYFAFRLNISLPWQPISIMGIAVAFYLGFKNNSSYDRVWEARKIWGSIVNDSRSFTASTKAFIQGDRADELIRELIYRHIAWMTALRHQLRLSREWEHTEDRVKGFSKIVCEDYYNRLDTELGQYLSPEEIAFYRTKSNMATQILMKQAERLQALKNEGYYDDFRHMQLQGLVHNLYVDQGKSERIKNFPFPRQYASAALWLTWVFCALLPLGMLDIFYQHSGWMFWLSPVMSALITWIFFLMEKIGDYSENPFEGTYNDVPITSIAKGIEIDLREAIDDQGIPEPLKAREGILL